jgi:hypothetical protein
MSRRPGRAARALLLALVLLCGAPSVAAACTPAAAPLGAGSAGGADGGQPAPPPPPRPLPPGSPEETHGGVPYDPSRDRGCVCGPNGGAELYKARVYRWADDCLTSQEPTCATRDAAIADSVERLYSEFVCGASPWQDSGFLAPPPGWATSRHNRAGLFASDTCVGGRGEDPGEGSPVAGGDAPLGVEPFFLRVLGATIDGLLGDYVTALLGEIGQTGDRLLDNDGACALYRPSPALTYGHPAIRAYLAAFRGLALALLIASLGIGLLGKFGLGASGVATVGGLALLGRLALTTGLIALYPTIIAALLDLANLLVLALLPLGLPDGLGFGDLVAIAPGAFILTPKAALILLNIGATLAVIVQGILRVALLDLLIILGPLALGCLVLPQLRPWFDRWARLLAGLFVLNVVQAFALRFASSFAAGLPRKEDPTGALGSLAAIVALVLVFRLPRLIAPHADQGAALLGQMTRQITVATLSIAAAAATGGTSAAAEGAVVAGGTAVGATLGAGAAGGGTALGAGAAGGGTALGAGAAGGGTALGAGAAGGGTALGAGAAGGGTALGAGAMGTTAGAAAGVGAAGGGTLGAAAGTGTAGAVEGAGAAGVTEGAGAANATASVGDGATAGVRATATTGRTAEGAGTDTAGITEHANDDTGHAQHADGDEGGEGTIDGFSPAQPPAAATEGGTVADAARADGDLAASGEPHRGRLTRDSGSVRTFATATRTIAGEIDRDQDEDGD